MVRVGLGLGLGLGRGSGSGLMASLVSRLLHSPSSMACWKERERCIHSSATAAEGSASLPGACMPCARSAESTWLGLGLG